MSAGKLPWIVLLLGLVSVGLHLFARLYEPPSGLATLPIFVPASLSYEEQLRQERGQPAGRGGMEAAELAEALLELRPGPAVEQPLSRLRQTREALLDARNRRHALNTRLMQAGVRIGSGLGPAQWEHVLSSRDAVRAEEEARLFDTLEQSLHRP